MTNKMFDEISFQNLLKVSKTKNGGNKQTNCCYYGHRHKNLFYPPPPITPSLSCSNICDNPLLRVAHTLSADKLSVLYLQRTAAAAERQLVAAIAFVR